MQHVLILTKNALAEEATVNKLQRMNCEIFCSPDLLKRLQQGTLSPFLSYFHGVILSESLCHSEVEGLLQLLKDAPLSVLRLVETLPTEEEQAHWRELGLTEWVEKSTSYESLRETVTTLSQLKEQEQAANHALLTFPNQEEVPVNNLHLLLKSLSKTEKKVFQYLIEAYPKSQTLSRSEMCEYLWPDGKTPSNMSQLSCLINKLKRKLDQHGLKGDTITTQWGRGYQLTKEVYEYWLAESQQLENQQYATM